jgi:hypothetical protein
MTLQPVPGGTYRESLQASLSNPACAACHTYVDGPGFAFENYDPIGRFRTLDNGKPIDASGRLAGTMMGDLAFMDARDLARLLPQSCEVQMCMAQVFLSHAVLDPAPNDSFSYNEVLRAFAASGFNLAELLVLVTGSHGFASP